MPATSRVAAAVAAGYLLGRTKKLKLAITVGSLLAGRKLAGGSSTTALLHSLTENPEMKKLEDQLRGRLMEAAKMAAVNVATSRVEAITASLREGAQKDNSESGGAEEDEGAQGAAESEGGQQAQGGQSEGGQDESSGDSGEESAQSSAEDSEEEPSAPPVKKAAAKKAPAKKAPAKKAPAAAKTARKAPAAAKKVAAKRPASGARG